jgi:hypothetical protein
MTEKVETKPAAAPKAAAPKKPKKVLIAVHSINGEIAPGTPFTGSAKELTELLELGAAREPEGDAEEALIEKIGGSVVSLGDADDLAAALD